MNDLGHKYRLFAEVVAVEEQTSNDVYMQVELRMMSTAPNGNGCIVEKEFMEAVVNNPAFYNATPVKVDINALVSGKSLGHRFDKKRKEWLADQIGAITEFYLKEEDGETVMYGKARIEKSRADVVEALTKLYEDGNLYFSFEITAKDIIVDEENELVRIGASENNHLTAMCVVSVPAYDGAVAITFVAEMENDMEKTVNHEELLKWAAELEVNEVHCKVFELLYHGPLKDNWNFECREFGVNYLLLKNSHEGTYKKVEFHVDENDEVILDAIYDVEFTRVAEVEEEPAEEPTEEKVEAEAEQVQEEAAEDEEPEKSEEQTEEEPVTETETEEQQEEVSEEETEPVETEEEVSTEEAEEVDDMNETDEVQEVDNEIDELKRELEELRKYRDEIERQKQEAKKEREVKKLRYAAEKLGIDTKDLEEAIDSLDYQKVMASLCVIESNTETTPVVNPFVGDGVTLKKSRWEGYVSDPTGLGD